MPENTIDFETDDPLSQRRKPRQERSRKRRESILRTAEAIVVRDGFNALTTARIASEAGLPVGTVYYLFPNKYAIVAQLMEDCMEGVNVILGKPYGALPWETALDERIDALAAHWHREHGFSELWRALRNTSELEEANRLAQEQGFEGMLRFVRYALPDSPEFSQQRIATSMVHVADRLLEESVQQSSETERLALIDELKRMLRSYVRSYC